MQGIFELVGKGRKQKSFTTREKSIGKAGGKLEGKLHLRDTFLRIQTNFI